MVAYSLTCFRARVVRSWAWLALKRMESPNPKLAIMLLDGRIEPRCPSLCRGGGTTLGSEKWWRPRLVLKTCACDELAIKILFHSRLSKSWTRWLVLGTCWATRCRRPRMATGWPLLRLMSRSVNYMIDLKEIDLLESTLCLFTEFNCRVRPSLALAQLHQSPRTSPQKQQFTTSPPSWAVIPQRKSYRQGAPSRTGSRHAWT